MKVTDIKLPVTIEELIHGDTLERERLKFIKYWEPNAVFSSMETFANGLHIDGGYIIVGVEEIDGCPVLPPKGLNNIQTDLIQKEMVQLGQKIAIDYTPIIHTYILCEKVILIIWCPVLEKTSMKTIENLRKDPIQYSDKGNPSNSIVALGDSHRSYREAAVRIPFDDRINNEASIEDFDLILILEHLQEVNTSLLTESTKMTFPELCRRMQIAEGPDEDLRPVNVGLLMFCKFPEHFFPKTRIELVIHKNSKAEHFEEFYFEGPIQNQLREALHFIKTEIIREIEVKKRAGARPDHIFNYPFEAVEQALANAVYHKSYELGSPIEIQVFSNEITILSHRGPVPPVKAKILSEQKRIIAREYRNRRIGDFLKELQLTRGRGAGFPIIYRVMSENGSPKPLFESDNKLYVLVRLPIHPDALHFDPLYKVKDFGEFNEFSTVDDIISFIGKAENQLMHQDNPVEHATRNSIREILNNEIHSRIPEILRSTKNWIRRDQLFSQMGLSNKVKNRKKYLNPLLELGWIQIKYTGTSTYPHQSFKITESGKGILEYLVG